MRTRPECEILESKINSQTEVVVTMSTEINKVVVNQGLKIDHILKKTKETQGLSKKSNNELVKLSERNRKVSICYRFVVTLSIMSFILFLVVFILN